MEVRGAAGFGTKHIYIYHISEGSFKKKPRFKCNETRVPLSLSAPVIHTLHCETMTSVCSLCSNSGIIKADVFEINKTTVIIFLQTVEDKTSFKSAAACQASSGAKRGRVTSPFPPARLITVESFLPTQLCSHLRFGSWTVKQ